MPTWALAKASPTSSATRSAQPYGFDASCGLDRDPEVDLWRLGSSGDARAIASARSGCVIDGDHDSASYSCFCAHQEQALVGDLDPTKIPALKSFGELDTASTKDALVELCDETFHAQCGPLPTPMVADCGTPTKDFCEVSIRGDRKESGYNLVDTSCLCQGKRRWQSAQRLTVPISSVNPSAATRCESQLESCRIDQAPSFSPVQMLNEKGYTDQKVSCSSFGNGRWDTCTVYVEKGGERIGNYCSCNGAETGGSTIEGTPLGAKSLYNACLKYLGRCSKLGDSLGDGDDDCDTSSASDEDCESTSTSTVGDDSDTESSTDQDDSGDTGADDDDDSDEEPTETGTGEPEPQPKPSDVLESLGCQVRGQGLGGLGTMLGWGLFGLIGVGRWRSRRTKVKTN